MREIIKQASTVDEAIELALRELNLTREQVTCEVLEYPEKRFSKENKSKIKAALAMRSGLLLWLKCHIFVNKM